MDRLCRQSKSPPSNHGLELSDKEGHVTELQEAQKRQRNGCSLSKAKVVAKLSNSFLLNSTLGFQRSVICLRCRQSYLPELCFFSRPMQHVCSFCDFFTICSVHRRSIFLPFSFRILSTPSNSRRRSCFNVRKAPGARPYLSSLVESMQGWIQDFSDGAH